MGEKIKNLPKNPFLVQELGKLEKTEADVATEKVIDFLDRAIIGTEGQISERTVTTIPTLNRKLKNLQDDLVKANKKLALAETSLPKDGELQTYLDNLYVVELEISDINNNIETIKSNIETVEKEVAKLKVILERFKIPVA